VSEVHKGTVLFEIDSRPYQAELAKADAEVLRCGARRQRAQFAVRRAERLFATKAMSQEDFDLARGELEDAQALIRVARAGLNSWNFLKNAKARSTKSIPCYDLLPSK
jgi:multidrug resistance efflux pump